MQRLHASGIFGYSLGMLKVPRIAAFLLFCTFLAYMAATQPGCASVPELKPPEEPGARVAWWLGKAETACLICGATAGCLTPDLAAACAPFGPPAPTVTAPSAGDGGATPAVGGASNGVRHVGGGGGGL